MTKKYYALDAQNKIHVFNDQSVRRLVANANELTEISAKRLKQMFPFDRETTNTMLKAVQEQQIPF